MVTTASSASGGHARKYLRPWMQIRCPQTHMHTHHTHTTTRGTHTPIAERRALAPSDPPPSRGGHQRGAVKPFPSQAPSLNHCQHLCTWLHTHGADTQRPAHWTRPALIHRCVPTQSQGTSTHCKQRCEPSDPVPWKVGGFFSQDGDNNLTPTAGL